MADNPILRVDHLTVDFRGGSVFSLDRTSVRAVADVSLEVSRGQAFGTVGESGSGKTTLGRCVLGLQQPTAGTVEIDGIPIGQYNSTTLHRRVQAVFQNPIASLNPAMAVKDILAEPLRRLRGTSDKSEIRRRTEELLDEVRLPHSVMERRPTSLSGGMAQRVSIARALAADPDLIVLDEAVSALDVATQAQVINLLGELRDETGVAYLFIAHDLAVVRHLCEEIAVMRTGEIVEAGIASAICDDPQHEYTQRLIAAVPVPDPRVRRIRHQYIA